MKPRHFIRPLELLLICLLLALGGCGKKGPVKPLEKPLPSAPNKLSAVQQGQRIQLAWELPTTNQDGSPLKDLQGFNVFKMRYDPANDCPECRDTSTLLLQVDLEFLKNVERRGDRLILWDTELEPGYGYQYRVVPYTQNNREGQPAVVRLPFSPPVAAPQGLTAAEHDSMARLQWQPLTVPTGVELLGYNLYRKAPGENPPLAPINSAPLTETAFDDFGVQNNVTYEYTLRAVVKTNDIVLESMVSAPLAVTPKAGQ